MTLCSDVGGYQCFGGPCCLHLQGEAAQPSETLTSYHISMQCCNPEDLDMNFPHLVFNLHDPNSVMTLLESSV